MHRNRQGPRNAIDDERYDRYLAHNEQSTVHKLKETYWTTKQYVKKKLGKKEDEHIVASDAQLDAKLEVFRSIQKSSMDLLRAIEKYQEQLCALSQEENEMGRFLKSCGGQDKTRAGKMMIAVGKAQGHASQQRLALRPPLVRLYQEVETFRYRAISDTLITINRMEAARTEYRGALLWMKDISENLDPDTYKQLEKFRKVQAQVKKTKARFDKLKLDVMQKVDLLAASRSNMFSHVLVTYQSTLLQFWQKTARTHTAVAESFKGYQYYEFSMLKELSEPSKELAKQSGQKEVADTDLDRLGEDEEKRGQRHKAPKPTEQQDNSRIQGLGLNQDLLGLLDQSQTSSQNHTESQSGLMEFDITQREYRDEEDKGTHDRGSLNNLYQAQDSQEDRSGGAGGAGENLLELEDEGESIEEIKRKQDEELGDFLRRAQNPQSSTPQTAANGKQDLLTEDLDLGGAGQDDMALLNQILNAPPAADDFSNEWASVFGDAPLQPASAGIEATSGGSGMTGQGPSATRHGAAKFMPSSLLDMGMTTQGMAAMNIGNAGAGPGMMPGMLPQSRPTAPGTQQQPSKVPQPRGKQQPPSHMSAWFKLFADLDPLSNPDAIGKEQKDVNAAL